MRSAVITANLFGRNDMRKIDYDRIYGGGPFPFVALQTQSWMRHSFFCEGLRKSIQHTTVASPSTHFMKWFVRSQQIFAPPTLGLARWRVRYSGHMKRQTIFHDGSVCNGRPPGLSSAWAMWRLGGVHTR
jgi:hypothetical protein